MAGRRRCRRASARGLWRAAVRPRLVPGDGAGEAFNARFQAPDAGLAGEGPGKRPNGTGGPGHIRAAVTGCAGFIGSHLTDSLLGAGHEVLGVDCFNDNYARAIKRTNLEGAQQYDTFDFVPLDLTVGGLEDIVDEVEVIFHLAAEPGVRSSWGGRFENYLRNNILATQKLLETVKERGGGQRVVYASTSSVYGHAEMLPTPEDALPQPYSPYGVTKLAAEGLCHLYWGNHGVEGVALRFFSVYGPRQRPDMAFNHFCRAALRGEELHVFGDGEQTRDFTFVQDIVQAARAAADVPEAAGGIYNVGGGCRVSVNDALHLLAGYAGRPLDISYEDVVRGDVRDTGADTTRARRDLGYAPDHTFSEGLRAEFEWIVEQGQRAQRIKRVARAGSGSSAPASSPSSTRRRSATSPAACASPPWRTSAPRTSRP